MRLAVLSLLVLCLGGCALGVPMLADEAGGRGDSDGGGGASGASGAGGGSGSSGNGGSGGATDGGDLVDGSVDGSLAGTGGDAAAGAGGSDAATPDAGNDAAMPTGPKRKKLSIAAADTVGAVGSHADFPVLVVVTGTHFLDLKDDVDANGYDLRFTSDAAGTVDLPFERARYDATGNQLVAWVQVDVVDAGQDFYLVYGEGDVTDKASGGVWSNGYEAVWHLDDVGNLADASGKGKTGVNHGATNVSNGIAGGAASFDGSADYVSASPFAAIDGGTFTVSAWVIRNGTSTYDYILSQGDNGATREAFHWGLENSGDGNNFRFAFWGDDLNSSGAFGETGSYVYWVGTFDNPSKARTLYRDAVQVGNDTGGGSLNTTGDFDIGRQTFSNTDYWAGTIDEVRVSSVVRTGNWIRTEHNNQKPGSTFLTMGAEEAL